MAGKGHDRAAMVSQRIVRLEYNLKKILLGVVLLGATSAAALAADLPSRRAPPVYYPPVAPIPVFTWTGLYGGINAGYAFNSHTSFNSAGVAAGTPTFLRSSSNGFTGGGQIGYNMQIGNAPLFGGLGLGAAGGGLVLGVEADAAYTDLRQNQGFGAAGFNARTDFVGTARGRVGYAFGNLLVFGTGGFAYGGVNDALGAAHSDTIRTGYAYGGGLEYAIPTTTFVNVFHSSAVTLKAEYLHYNLGSGSLNGGVGVTSVKTQGDLVRAGINYKLDLFGSPAAPVVARY